MRSYTADFGASLFEPQPAAQWQLPKRLREISGLALTPDGRVMGHDDEVAVIYQLDVDTGAVVKRFAAGEPAQRGDFEGLAIDGDGQFYLSTSLGRVLRFREADDQAWTPFEAFDTGMRLIGEVEGLAWHLGENAVIMACKTNYVDALRASLVLYAWSPAAPDQAARIWLQTPVAPLAEAIGARSFHPSSLEIDPRTGRLIVLAARENAMVELDPQGNVLAARWLGRQHRQAEGATILPGGDLVITDEGGNARALMTRYARVRDD